MTAFTIDTDTGAASVFTAVADPGKAWFEGGWTLEPPVETRKLRKELFDPKFAEHKKWKKKSLVKTLTALSL